MPQRLTIEAGGDLLGEMNTSHRSDTSYDITWQCPGSIYLSFPNSDTGIQRQPGDVIERFIDFQNDFLHARQSIGAAYITASQVLEELSKYNPEVEAVNTDVIIQLTSNTSNRGLIQTRPEECGRAKAIILLHSLPN